MIWLWLPLLIVMALWLWPRAFARAVSGRVEGFLTASRAEMNPGDEVSLCVTLVNRSWMPIPLAEVEIELPPQLSFHCEQASRLGRVALSVLPRRQADIEFRAYAWRRGPAHPVQARAALSEGLGLLDTHIALDNRVSLAVRPRQLRVGPHFPFAPSGWMTRESRAFPDETALRSVRPYVMGDPVRHIHWRASARLGQLMVKEFFTTEAPDWAIVLSAQATDPYWAGALHPDTFDAMCEQALAIAQWLTRGGGRVDFATNAACGNRQRATIAWLSAEGVASLLAHAQPIATCDLDALATALARSPSSPRHWIVLSPRAEGAAKSWTSRFGVQVTWISARPSAEEDRQDATVEASHDANR
ncbi:DUF58 domain-containing protein [Alicyclobacillus acidocaldarius]|uniref:DUF58 domain-containing protein n=1 Tax=Alicyclobacillus acidocaldarius (strain Tc-4-1) TaxID=1048834 RepID=F8IFT8_ALIAT|nr:DUF58 domain-containing protein [Alicyclobacillus acidocaldarius]AEJ44172.1 protein of unknown function DUF58 [Alicyclobacillus acidocaldarius subsp. acidocaldarius Tc-4-1]